MATGRRAFEGESQASVIAAILEKMPKAVGELRAEVPAGFDRLVKTCLEKDPDSRFQSAHDVGLQLSWLGNEAAVARGEAPPRHRALAAWLLAVAALAASAWLFVGTSGNVASSVGPVHFSFHPAGFGLGLQDPLPVDGWETVAVSPDGSRMAFIANSEEGTDRVWIRPFAEPTATPLAGTDGARQIFWSHDGDRIAFRARRGLFAIPAAGGPVQRIVSEGALSGHGGSWGRNGVVLVGGFDGLVRVEPGGEPTRVGDLEWSMWPSFLPDAWSPDGGEILFLNEADPSMNVWSLPPTGGKDPAPVSPPIRGTVNTQMRFSPDGRWLALVSLESGRGEIHVQPYRRPGARIRLSQEGGRRPRWRRDGRELFFQSGQSVLSVPVEMTPGENFVSGPPTTLFTLDAPFTFLDTTYGERFLVLMEPTRDSWQPIQVMISWKELLPRARN